MGHLAERNPTCTDIAQPSGARNTRSPLTHRGSLAHSRLVPVALLTAALLVAVSSATAQAADVKPSRSACSNGAETYARLTVDTAKAPVGASVTFTGTLSSRAHKYLKSWTAGSNIVCLDRYPIAPLADGWPGTALDGACVKVRNDGSFTIMAEFRKVGVFYCGVSMSPCRSSADECGNGDPGLGGPMAVRHRTTR